MKKILVFILLALALTPCFSFSFVAVPEKPLYTESISDPYGFSTQLHIMTIPKAEDNEFKVNCLLKDTNTGLLLYDNLYYRNPRSADENRYMHMKLAANVSLFRLNFEKPSLELDLNLLGYLNTIFWLSGSSEALTFDGSFQISASMRLSEMFTLRFGIHHFSGHYGDELLDKFVDYNKIDYNSDGTIYNYTGESDSTHTYQILSQTEYVRDNSWMIGLQTELPFGLRIYAQCEIPQKSAWIRPFVHVPADYINPSSKDPSDVSSIHKSSGMEGAQEQPGLVDAVEAQKRGTSYMALRVQAGMEYTLNMNWASLILSADVQAHQDGQNRGEDGRPEILAYKADNPWEFEYTLAGALALKQKLGSKDVRIEVSYHVGRTPATQWFYKRGTFVSFGLGLN